MAWGIPATASWALGPLVLLNMKAQMNKNAYAWCDIHKVVRFPGPQSDLSCTMANFESLHVVHLSHMLLWVQTRYLNCTVFPRSYSTSMNFEQWLKLQTRRLMKCVPSQTSEQELANRILSSLYMPLHGQYTLYQAAGASVSNRLLYMVWAGFLLPLPLIWFHLSWLSREVWHTNTWPQPVPCLPPRIHLVKAPVLDPNDNTVNVEANCYMSVRDWLEQATTMACEGTTMKCCEKSQAGGSL